MSWKFLENPSVDDAQPHDSNDTETWVYRPHLSGARTESRHLKIQHDQNGKGHFFQHSLLINR